VVEGYKFSARLPSTAREGVTARTISQPRRKGLRHACECTLTSYVTSNEKQSMPVSGH